MQQDLIENTNYLPLKLYSLILQFENTLIHLFCYIFVLLIVFGGASSLAFLEKKKNAPDTYHTLVETTYSICNISGGLEDSRYSGGR